MNRCEYLALFPSASAAIEHENTVLSIGSEFLPPFARAVRDGEEPTPEYWAWLVTAIREARAADEFDALAREASLAECTRCGRPGCVSRVCDEPELTRSGYPWW